MVCVVAGHGGCDGPCDVAVFQVRWVARTGESAVQRVDVVAGSGVQDRRVRLREEVDVQ